MPKFTLKKFKELYPNDNVCLDKIFQIRYGSLTDCPKCNLTAGFYRVKKRMSYACKHCGYQLYPLANTPFHKTRIPLTHWFTVIFMQTITRNGVSAKEIERMLGVTYKCAFRIGHQVRKLMTADKPEMLSGGIVEMDDLKVGGLFGNMHTKRRMKYTLKDNKNIVIAMVQRDGQIITKVVDSLRHRDIKRVIQDSIDKDTDVYTDSFVGFKGILKPYKSHETVNHKAKEYVRGDVHSNTVEGFFSQVTRTLSTHVQVSKKYLQVYVDECAWRYMNRDRQAEMFELILKNVCST